MERYLQGQDLWELITGNEAVIPKDTPQNSELRWKWKIKCGKAMFTLRTSINKKYIKHARDTTLSKRV